MLGAASWGESNRDTTGMIAFGIILLLLGGIWEISIFLRAAWPTYLTWCMMGCGSVFVSVGLYRREKRAGIIAIAFFVLAAVIICGLWMIS